MIIVINIIIVKGNSLLPERMTAIKRTTKDPEKRPTLKVVHGLCFSPNGGTRSLFIAFCLSPDSSSFVKVTSVSLINLVMSLFV